jgi:hypothetical protein
MPKVIALRNGAVAAALMAAAPAGAQDYPNRIVMWVFSPTASTALTLALGPV